MTAQLGLISKAPATASSILRHKTNLAVIRVLRQTRFNAIAVQSFRQFSATMQPMTADDRPNILSDIKRDHA
jgi:hypothetical protein